MTSWCHYHCLDAPWIQACRREHFWMTSYGLQVRIQRIYLPSTHFRRAYIHFTCACGHVDAHSHLCYLTHLGDEFVCCLGVLSRFLGPSLYLLVRERCCGGNGMVRNCISSFSCHCSRVCWPQSAVTEVGAIDHTAVPAGFP